MTDKEFTDEEIINALECCISTTTDDACVGCPFNNQKLCDKDQLALERYALDLIKRQKAETENAKAKIKICAEVIERQDTEIERLKECPKCVYEYDGEITEYCVQGPCTNFKTVEQIKAEAYKEFAERLKEQIRLDDDCNYKCRDCCYECNDYVIAIDNLLKEMVGKEE